MTYHIKDGGIMDDSDEDVLKILGNILKQLEIKYNSPSNQTAVQRHMTGLISVDVHDKPMYWFFDEDDFLNWIREHKNGLE
jgi:hypothetical protein